MGHIGLSNVISRATPTGSAATQAYMLAYGVPGFLVWPTTLWEPTAGVCLALNKLPRLIPLGLVGWCLLTAAIFHRDWADGMQQMHFFKNLTMAGAFAILAVSSATLRGVSGRQDPEGWAVWQPDGQFSSVSAASSRSSRILAAFMSQT